MHRVSQKLVAAMVSLLAVLPVSTNSWGAIAFYSTPFSVFDVFSSDVGTTFSGSLSGLQLRELPRFNPTFGTLQSVEIQFQSNYGVFIEGHAFDERAEFSPFPFNPSNDAGIDASVSGSLTMQLFDPSSSIMTLNFPLVNAFCYERITDVGIASCLAVENTRTAYNALMPLGALALSSFVGTDPINLVPSLNATFSGSCDGDDLTDACQLGARVEWGGFVGVAYNYALNGVGEPPGNGGGNTVPAPPSAPLIATGLVLLALFRRAKTRRSSI